MILKRIYYIMQNTLYTGPNPPSPILLEKSKLFVAALICLKVNKPVSRSKLFSSVSEVKKRLKICYTKKSMFSNLNSSCISAKSLTVMRTKVVSL